MARPPHCGENETGLVEIADYFFATQTDLDRRPMRFSSFHSTG